MWAPRINITVHCVFASASCTQICLCNTDLICTVTEHNPVRLYEQNSTSFLPSYISNAFVHFCQLLYFFTFVVFQGVNLVTVVICGWNKIRCRRNHFSLETVGNNVSADCKSHKKVTTQKLMLQEHLFFPSRFSSPSLPFLVLLSYTWSRWNKKYYQQAFFHFLVIV